MLRLQQKSNVQAGVWNASSLQPLLLAAMTIDQMQRVQLSHGRSRIEVGELFDILGQPSAIIELHVSSLILNDLGSRMSGGQLEVFGHVGDGTGQAMTGGNLKIHGNVGQAAGAGMRGGSLIIKGDAGDRLGGISPITGRGQRGGDILVAGNAGDYVGAKMRRGITYIGGNAGDFGADRMVAGTIVVGGRIGSHWGYQMRRGSIILAQESQQTWAAELSPSYRFELSFLPLLWKHLQTYETQIELQIPTTNWTSRQVGDLSCRGIGEVLTLTR